MSTKSYHRDNFSAAIKTTLARRVGMLCSICKTPTVGPHKKPTKSVNIGVAAHITGAAINSPRYDETYSAKQRKSILNGIWVCASCGIAIDLDVNKYKAHVLRKLKRAAEQDARKRLTKIRHKISKHKLSDHGKTVVCENVECPKCKKVMKVSISTLSGSAAVPLCEQCGLFHVHRKYDGSLIIRAYGGGKKHINVVCPMCSNKLQVQEDNRIIIKPCLECESLIQVKDSTTSIVGRMDAILAKDYTSENKLLLLICPRCNVKANTIGTNGNNIRYAQCMKCKRYLKRPNPLAPPTAEHIKMLSLDNTMAKQSRRKSRIK